MHQSVYKYVCSTFLSSQRMRRENFLLFCYLMLRDTAKKQTPFRLFLLMRSRTCAHYRHTVSK
jgi:hypothetical protein